jgi:hypothetical protein
VLESEPDRLPAFGVVHASLDAIQQCSDGRKQHVQHEREEANQIVEARVDEHGGGGCDAGSIADKSVSRSISHSLERE